MDTERYDRQLRIAELGTAGQQKLAAARVLVVGAGGLGSPVLFYLAAAGVGTLGIADGDVVALSNLNRQILHRTRDIDVDKVASAARALGDLNPDVKLETYAERLDVERTAELAASYDLLIDAADSFVSKYLLNDAAIRAGTPLMHAGVEGLAGQLALLGLPDGPCLRCVYPDAPADPSEPRAILGATAGV
ncbi:MAG: HesA/MoeB/ThiF family protein, partial [Deltaproteobacteria bacterium]|nr:HesA/MoeB/ThiF family protein [Deltaproteobacteria bacterium]